MIKSSIYSPGYVVVLKYAVSDVRIYVCSTCCHCVLLRGRSACIRKLPDDNARASKHVGAVE
jgi:hypothetical protein